MQYPEEKDISNLIRKLNATSERSGHIDYDKDTNQKYTIINSSI